MDGGSKWNGCARGETTIASPHQLAGQTGMPRAGRELRVCWTSLTFFSHHLPCGAAAVGGRPAPPEDPVAPIRHPGLLRSCRPQPRRRDRWNSFWPRQHAGAPTHPRGGVEPQNRLVELAGASPANFTAIFCSGILLLPPSIQSRMLQAVYLDASTSRNFYIQWQFLPTFRSARQLRHRASRWSKKETSLLLQVEAESDCGCCRKRERILHILSTKHSKGSKLTL
jgi:hypothetical protein